MKQVPSSYSSGGAGNYSISTSNGFREHSPPPRVLIELSTLIFSRFYQHRLECACGVCINDSLRAVASPSTEWSNPDLDSSEPGPRWPSLSANSGGRLGRKLEKCGQSPAPKAIVCPRTNEASIGAFMVKVEQLEWMVVPKLDSRGYRCSPSTRGSSLIPRGASRQSPL